MDGRPASPLIEGVELAREFAVRGPFLGRRRTLRAVDGVSLGIGEVETVALVGESGSGKSTLGRLLLGLLAPTAGEVRYAGRDVASLSGAAWRQFRREVQVIYQDTATSLNPRKTIGETLEVPLRHNLGLPARAATARLPG